MPVIGARLVADILLKISTPPARASAFSPNK